VKIAEILDRTSTLFIPNSQLRLATPAGRQNQQADFLIFHQNKLGILKIDSELSHPNTTEDENCDFSEILTSLLSSITTLPDAANNRI